jgi:hypothetical protein
MNKERYNQIIDEVYENYLNNFIVPICPPNLDVQPNFEEPLLKENFIKLIKHSKGFSEKWGLKIEERELSLDDRAKLHPNPENFYDIHGTFSISDSIENSNFPDKDWLHEQFDDRGIPTKLITLTYNNEKIGSHE